MKERHTPVARHVPVRRARCVPRSVCVCVNNVLAFKSATHDPFVCACVCFCLRSGDHICVRSTHATSLYYSLPHTRTVTWRGPAVSYPPPFFVASFITLAQNSSPCMMYPRPTSPSSGCLTQAPHVRLFMCAFAPRSRKEQPCSFHACCHFALTPIHRHTVTWAGVGSYAARGIHRHCVCFSTRPEPVSRLA